MYASSTRNPGATTTGRTAASSAEPRRAGEPLAGSRRGERHEAAAVWHGPPVETHNCTVTLGRAIENSGEWIVRLVRLLAGKKFLAKSEKVNQAKTARNVDGAALRTDGDAAARPAHNAHMHKNPPLGLARVSGLRSQTAACLHARGRAHAPAATCRQCPLTTQ